LIMRMSTLSRVRVLVLDVLLKLAAYNVFC
jgi:hypothetical protein